MAYRAESVIQIKFRGGLYRFAERIVEFEAEMIITQKVYESELSVPKSYTLVLYNVVELVRNLGFHGIVVFLDMTQC